MIASEASRFLFLLNTFVDWFILLTIYLQFRLSFLAGSIPSFPSEEIINAVKAIVEWSAIKRIILKETREVIEKIKQEKLRNRSEMMLIK